jgi:hypothetical protein
MNLWKAAHPSDTWPPQNAYGAVNNEFEEAGWYCFPCHPSKANASTLVTDVSTTTASISTTNALTAATTANAASTGKVIDIDAPSNAILVNPPNKRSAGKLGQKQRSRRIISSPVFVLYYHPTSTVGEGLEGKEDAFAANIVLLFQTRECRCLTQREEGHTLSNAKKKKNAF